MTAQPHTQGTKSDNHCSASLLVFHYCKLRKNVLRFVEGKICWFATQSPKQLSKLFHLIFLIRQNIIVFHLATHLSTNCIHKYLICSHNCGLWIHPTHGSSTEPGIKPFIGIHPSPMHRPKFLNSFRQMMQDMICYNLQKMKAVQTKYIHLYDTIIAMFMSLCTLPIPNFKCWRSCLMFRV